MPPSRLLAGSLFDCVQQCSQPELECLLTAEGGGELGGDFRHRRYLVGGEVGVSRGGRAAHIGPGFRGGGSPGRGVEVSDIETFPWGRFCFFSDPDGNTWSVHEPPPAA
jgi:catechol 2,3-dioxygenase-like lactoylglutathione lyase family enzyme